MNEGQRTTLELLVVLGLFIVFVSSYGRGFWATLFSKNPYTIEPPAINWPTIAIPGVGTLGGGSVFPQPSKPSSGAGSGGGGGTGSSF